MVNVFNYTSWIFYYSNMFISYWNDFDPKS